MFKSESSAATLDLESPVRPQPLTVQVFRKMEDVPRHEWNRVFSDPLEGYDFFKTLDESGYEEFDFYYFLVSEGDSTVGAAPCFRMSYPLATTAKGAIKTASDAIRKIFPN